MHKPLSAQEALIWVMVTTAIADRNMTERELNQFERLIGFLPVFQGFEGSVGEIADACLFMSMPYSTSICSTNCVST